MIIVSRKKKTKNFKIKDWSTQDIKRRCIIPKIKIGGRIRIIPTIEIEGRIRMIILKEKLKQKDK